MLWIGESLKPVKSVVDYELVHFRIHGNYDEWSL